MKPTWSDIESAESALKAEIAAILTGRSRTPRELRRKVQELTLLLQSIGFPPEKVLVRVKATAFAAGYVGQLWADSVELPFRDGKELSERLVSWCIESYYDSAQGAGAGTNAARMSEA